MSVFLLFVSLKRKKDINLGEQSRAVVSKRQA